MEIIYSQHLKMRLEIREIPHDLPKIIYQTSKERYFDKETFKKVAVKELKYKGKFREIVVIYEERNG